jgi:16S rRNA (cytosine1402-N4)-methyltransferase
MTHIPVLLNEIIDGLKIAAGEVFVDATLGAGGHTEEVCRLFGRSVRLIAIDRDQHAIDRARERLMQYQSDVVFVNDNFRNLSSILSDLSIPAVDKVLFDLGFSSDQLDSDGGEEGRGFSFQKDEPLLMTFETNPDTNSLTAKEIVNEWPEIKLAELFKELGEERFAVRIAGAIASRRKESAIETSGQLAELVKDAVPAGYEKGRIHPATRTFQALRIAVNGELTALQEGLKAAWEKLNPQGRIAVISFHSLEDRIVKQYFRGLLNSGGEPITKKPIIASADEISANPRARSAKLRIIKKQ